MRKMKRRILFVDDQIASVEGIKSLLEENGFDCRITGFNNIHKILQEFNPAVAILDYKLNDQEKPGIEWAKYIWEHKFIPIIFHSAFSMELQKDDEIGFLTNHPFIKIIQKGLESSAQIQKNLTELLSIMDILDKNELDFHNNYQKIKQDTLKNTLGYLLKNPDFSDNQKINAVLNRRFAVFLENENQSIREPFELFIYPPISKHLLTGDILQKDSNFYIILSPSCDLVPNQNPIEFVHVAKLETSQNIYKTINCTSDTKKTSFIRQFSSQLSKGYNNEFFILPPLYGFFDQTMLVNLKKCAYIEYNKISLDIQVQNEYSRIAALDSPFRETLIWAFMTISCRPGLPLCDLDKWASEIYENLHSENK